MDLAKFVSLLDREALYFPRVGIMHATDPYEGRFGDMQVETYSQPWPEEETEDLAETVDKSGIVRAAGAALTREDKIKLAMTIARGVAHSSELFIEKCAFINCWHMNTHESDAMWRLYSLQGQGIAVQSTFDRLERSLHMCPRQLHLGKVQYADYDKHMIDMANGFNLVMNKRSSFSHEAELRVAHMNSAFLHHPNPPPGVYANTDLEILIESVVVSPASPEWLLEVTTSLLKRYGLNLALARQSPLYSRRPRPPVNQG